MTPIIVLALGVGMIVLPAAPQPQSEVSRGSTDPPVAICATEEGGGRSTGVAITSTVAGDGQITIFSGGTTTGFGGYETGTSGSATVAIDEISAVGEAGALIEFPASDSAAAIVTSGETSLSAEVCSRIPDRQVVIGGASTIGGRRLQVQLMNPYASEAVVDVIGFSESGRETAENLETIIVPPRSSVIAAIHNVLPGRESLSLVVETTRGSVVASARADIDGESAVWRPLAPEETWYLPLPVYSGTRELIISSTTASDVAYQVDVFGPGGFEEAAIEGVVPDRGQTIVDLAGISEATIAVRVVAAAPVAVFARFSSDTGLAMGSASPIAASNWLLPGAGSLTGAVGRLAVVNVGLEAAEMTVVELRTSSRSRITTVQPGQVVELKLDEIASDGISLSSDGEIVPLWITERGTAVALSGGIPLIDE